MKLKEHSEQIDLYSSGRAKGRAMIKKQVEIHKAAKMIIKLEVDIAAINKIHQEIHDEMSTTKELIQQLERDLEIIQETKIKGIYDEFN